MKCEKFQIKQIPIFGRSHTALWWAVIETLYSSTFVEKQNEMEATFIYPF